MYIKQAFTVQHDWWRYVVGAIIAFFASQIGTLPFLALVVFKHMSNNGKLSELEDPNKIMTVLDANLTLFLMLLGFAVGLAGLLLVVKYMHKQSIRSLTTARPKIDWGRVWFGFGLIAVTTLVLTLLDYTANPENYVVQFKPLPFIILAVIAIVMIPLQTSFEEYLFRGYLMQGIGTMAKNRWLPLLVTSVIFGLLHIANPEVDKLGYTIMIYYIGTGLLLGIMTLMDDGLELALGFHAGNNLVGALLVTADWTVFQTPSIFKDISEPSGGYDVVLPVLVMYPIFLFIFAYRYKWKNWGEKLFGKIEATEPFVADTPATQ
ncbi:MAG: lysostaphin resistance A-like protein [Marinirhabdus sp.]